MKNQTHRIAAIAIAGLTLATLVSPGDAAIIVPGETADALVRDSVGGDDQGGSVTVLNVGAATLRTGRFDSNGATAGGSFNSASIFVFQLPDLGAVVDPFTSATFTFNLNSLNNSPGYAVDLYGIDARASSSVIADDFYVSGNLDPNAERLQDFILTNASSAGSHTSVDFSDWLNDQYNGGAGAGDFVFLRISARHTNAVVNNQTNGYIFATAEDPDSEDRPFLTLEAVPSPAALPAGLTMLGLVATRRRGR